MTRTRHRRGTCRAVLVPTPLLQRPEGAGTAPSPSHRHVDRPAPEDSKRRQASGATEGSDHEPRRLEDPARPVRTLIQFRGTAISDSNRVVVADCSARSLWPAPATAPPPKKTARGRRGREAAGPPEPAPRSPRKSGASRPDRQERPETGFRTRSRAMPPPPSYKSHPAHLSLKKRRNREKPCANRAR